MSISATTPTGPPQRREHQRRRGRQHEHHRLLGQQRPSGHGRHRDQDRQRDVRRGRRWAASSRWMATTSSSAPTAAAATASVAPACNSRPCKAICSSTTCRWDRRHQRSCCDGDRQRHDAGRDPEYHRRVPANAGVRERRRSRRQQRGARSSPGRAGKHDGRRRDSLDTATGQFSAASGEHQQDEWRRHGVLRRIERRRRDGTRGR